MWFQTPNTIELEYVKSLLWDQGEDEDGEDKDESYTGLESKIKSMYTTITISTCWMQLRKGWTSLLFSYRVRVDK